MRILGIDLGARSVKAVELDSAFGRFEIHDYHERTVEPDAEGRPDYKAAVSKLMASLPRTPDKIVAAARGGTVTFRNLKIPTRGKKAIQAAVGFELEDELPFPADRSFHDYSILGQTKQGSIVHVAVTLKSHIASLIETWNSYGVDPDVITTETWAYRTVLNRVIPQRESERPTLLVQIGDQRTTLHIHWHGAPALSREFDWGGRDLTLAIAKKYGISIEAAEKAKIDGFVIPLAGNKDLTPEQVEFSETLHTPLRELVRELHQAMLTCKNVTKENPISVLLSGGTSLLPGLAAYIHENLGIPVRPLHALSATSASGVSYSDTSEASFTLALGLALCLVGQERSVTINFRKGEFSKQAQSHEFRLQNFRWALISGAAVLASLVLSLAVQTQVYKGKIADADKQLKRNIQTFFGQISESSVRTYIASTSTLRSAVTQQLEQQRQLHSLVTPDPNSPLDVLRDFSNTIPKDTVVDVLQFQAGAAATAPYEPEAQRSIKLTVLVANPQIAERVSSLLRDKVTGLEKGNTEEVTIEGVKKWKVSFSGNLPSQAGVNGGN